MALSRSTRLAAIASAVAVALGGTAIALAAHAAAPVAADLPGITTMRPYTASSAAQTDTATPNKTNPASAVTTTTTGGADPGTGNTPAVDTLTPDAPAPSPEPGREPQVRPGPTVQDPSGVDDDEDPDDEAHETVTPGVREDDYSEEPDDSEDFHLPASPEDDESGLSGE